MKGLSVVAVSRALALLLSAALLAMGFWYLYPGARRLLPPLRNRAVPWSAAEIFLAYLLYRAVCPLLVAWQLQAIGFFDLVYGADFHVSFAGTNGEDARQNAFTRFALWVSTLALPLELPSSVFLL